MTIDIQKIEIFSQIEEGLRRQIEALFIKESYSRGDQVTRYGEPVDGLYLLDSGEVEVSIPGFEGVLAKLGEGQTFGEMSLFTPNEVASATVTVSSDTADMLFCPRDVLNLTLAVDEKLAAGFYRGSTLLMTSRLKSTNQKISDEITQSIQMARGLVDDISISGNLGMAQEDLETSGTVIVSGMTEIVKTLMVMKTSSKPIAPEEIAVLADKAREIYYSDFQVFERVNNWLKVLRQHLDNVTRILSQQETLEVEEDVSLQDLS